MNKQMGFTNIIIIDYFKQPNKHSNDISCKILV